MLVLGERTLRVWLFVWKRSRKELPEHLMREQLCRVETSNAVECWLIKHNLDVSLQRCAGAVHLNNWIHSVLSSEHACTLQRVCGCLRDSLCDWLAACWLQYTLAETEKNHADECGAEMFNLFSSLADHQAWRSLSCSWLWSLRAWHTSPPSPRSTREPWTGSQASSSCCQAF